MSSALAFRPVPGPDFLRFVASAGRSREAGSVSSQYEQDLGRQGGFASTEGLYACDRLVGAYSWATYPCERTAGISGRLDLVATDPAVRGTGLGGLLMARFITGLCERHGDRLEHVSTVAVHPAVKHFFAEAGFEGLAHGDTPLYQLQLDGPGRRRLQQHAAGKALRQRDGLKLRCLKCQRDRWARAWCRSPKEPKGSPGSL